MCAVSGCVHFLKSTYFSRENMIEGMGKAVEVLTHRGPDDSGFCGFSLEDGISFPTTDVFNLNKEKNIDGIFGFNRLSIKDLSNAGHQPMTTLNGKVIIIFNGEIYNDAELKMELLSKGYKFNSSTDTEVILNLYLEYGFDKMIRMLNGMFAIVIMDLREGQLYMGRDRFGIKPLYYTYQGGRLIFASELKAIIQFADFKRELDLEAVNARLIFARPSEKVLFKNVFLLDPGQAACFKRGENTPYFWRFFRIDDYVRDNHHFSNIEDAIDAAEDILCDAVSRQMVSDVKVGCQLSGGIDSTLVTYFANKMATDNLKDSVSIVDEHGVIGEEKYIEYVGKHLNLEAHKFVVPDDYFIQNYERMVWHNDAPVYKPFFSCFMRLAEESKKHVTVLLSGEGADEIAGGYTRFATGVFQPFISKLSENDSIKSYNSYAEYASMTDTTSTKLLTIGRESCVDLIQEQMNWFNGYSGSNLTKHLKFEIEHRLPESLLRQDKMTMANSIENRVPLLDNRVVDFIMQLPEDMLVRFSNISPINLSDNPLEWVQGKYIFKEIVSRHFGDKFAYRKKMTMDKAINERDILRSKRFSEYYHDAIFPKMKQRGIIDATIVNQWYENIDTIGGMEFISMWRAIGMETWCQLFMDSTNF